MTMLILMGTRATSHIFSHKFTKYGVQTVNLAIQQRAVIPQAIIVICKYITKKCRRLKSPDPTQPYILLEVSDKIHITKKITFF